MFRPPGTMRGLLWLLGSYLLAWQLAGGMPPLSSSSPVLPSLPLGLRSVVPSSTEGLLLGPVEGLKGGFAYGLGLTTEYNSNFFLTEEDEERELTIHLLPWIGYTSDPEGGAPFAFTAKYQPDIRRYINHPELDGIDHSGGISLELRGGKTRISGSVNYNTISGTDRFSGDFVTGSVFETALQASYQIAPRTSLYANWRYATTSYDTSTLQGSDMWSLEVGGLWAATERLSFGPSLSYSTTTSDNTGTREAWALSMQVDYSLGEKILLKASLGVQQETYSREGGDGTLGLTGGLTASYAITPRLSWLNSIEYVNVPSADQENYQINNIEVSSSLSYQLLRASVGLGVDVNFSEYVEVGPVGASLGNDENISVFMTYRRSLFLERMQLDSSLRYTINQGGSDWSQLLFTVGIQLEF